MEIVVAVIVALFIGLCPRPRSAPELEAAPEAYLGYNEDNDTWAVVNPRTGSVKLLEERAPLRQIEQRRG